MEDRSTSLRLFIPGLPLVSTLDLRLTRWLTEIEDGYRYRYWIVEINVTLEFIAVTYERWMLITRID